MINIKPLTPEQLKCINTIISKRGINKEVKADMINGFSNGRSVSSKDLFYVEAEALIKHLKATDPNAESIVKMKNKMLYYAHEMGWHKINNGRYVADIKRVDNWCLKYGHVKRKLDNYSYEELPMLLSQFEEVYKSYISKR